MRKLLGETDAEIRQTFELYERLGKMLAHYCKNVESEDDALNLTLLSTAMGMICNDICQELEDDGAIDCREHVVGNIAKFVFLNKRMMAH